MAYSGSPKNDRLWTILAALLALHLLNTFAVYPQLVDRGPTWLGLDDSARMALNFAWNKGLNWGHDMVYTYGPLSFLSTKVGWGIRGWIFLLTDFFVVLNFFLLFRDFMLDSRYRVLAAVVVFLMTLNLPLLYGSGLAWVLMVFIFYWMHRSYAAPRWWHFAMLTVLITLAFYLKLNTGLFTIVFLIVHLVLLFFARKITLLRLALTLGALGVLIWGSALLFNVSLPAYVKGAVEVMKGYNDLLYLYEDHRKSGAAIVLLFFGLCGVLALCLPGLLRRKQFVAIFLVLICMGYLFLLKKQGLFRNDRQHLEEFFAYAPLVLLCGVGTYILPSRQQLTMAGIGVVTLACLVLGAGQRPFVFLGNRFVARYSVPYRYVKEAADYNPAGYANQSDKRIIPPRILQRIVRNTVDVFPWDANYALQNGLAYYPRPCFQTFQANSDYLQQINYDFYQRSGPAFVIYDYDGIDNAYPFNDAPTLNLLLARNYRVADSFTSNERWRILLQKAPMQMPVRISKSGAATATLNTPIPPSAPYLKLDVSYTLKGKLMAIWNKPAPLQIAFQRPDGEWLTYKTSTELLKTGIYIGRLIRSNEDFARFAGGDTASLELVQAIRIVGDADYYRSSIGITWFSVQ